MKQSLQGKEISTPSDTQPIFLNQWLIWDFLPLFFLCESTLNKLKLSLESKLPKSNKLSIVSVQFLFCTGLTISWLWLSVILHFNYSSNFASPKYCKSVEAHYSFNLHFLKYSPLFVYDYIICIFMYVYVSSGYFFH